MKMPKSTAVSSVQLNEIIDTSVSKASWRKAGKKPNGQLDGAPFYWPKDVKKWLGRIERASSMLRRYNCGCCKKDRKAGVYCTDTYAMVRIVMRGLRLHKGHVHEMADAFAKLAHAPQLTDHSAEDEGD
jgi:hypothetical protein